MQVFKIALTTLVVGILALGAAAAGVVYSGAYNVAATDKHWPITYWVLNQAVHRSVERQSADIEAPEDDLRERIIRQRLAAMPMVDVPDNVVAYLVKHFTRNIRELEGALNKLLAYAALTGTTVDLTLAEDRLAENVRSARPRITHHP